MDLKYIGHSAFEIKLANNSILVDPYVNHNEKYNWHDANITDIFVTHAHSDHLGQAIEIAKEMLKENIDINIISKVTNLSISEINSL